MNEEQKGPIQQAIQLPLEISDEEKKRVMEAREKEVKVLAERIANIRRDLEKRPDNKYLAGRLKKLKARCDQLQKLNDDKVVTARIALRRTDFHRPRYFGLV